MFLHLNCKIKTSAPLVLPFLSDYKGQLAVPLQILYLALESKVYWNWGSPDKVWFHRNWRQLFTWNTPIFILIFNSVSLIDSLSMIRWHFWWIRTILRSLSLLVKKQFKNKVLGLFKWHISGIFLNQHRIIMLYKGLLTIKMISNMNRRRENVETSHLKKSLAKYKC